MGRIRPFRWLASGFTFVCTSVSNPFTFLAGGSGYPLKQWLLTPFPNPQSAEEKHYYVRHSQACAIMESTIGLFKGRWRCLDYTGGRLLYTSEKCQIVRVCAVLHNVAQLKNVPLPPDADGFVGPSPIPSHLSQTLLLCASVQK